MLTHECQRPARPRCRHSERVTQSPQPRAEIAQLIGATIYDVAQVVGAGYSVSDEAGVIATFAKMLRVALLPGFLVMFVGLAVLTNMNLLPDVLVSWIIEVSRWFLVIAISAQGVKTSLAQVVNVKPGYGAILVVETVFLLGIAYLFVTWVGI